MGDVDKKILGAVVDLERGVFRAPNFSCLNRGDANYLRSDDFLLLGSIKVPLRVEAFNSRREWQQHPVAFLHPQNGSSGNGDKHLVIFYYDLGFVSTPYDYSVRGLYGRARELRLHSGSMEGVLSLVDEME